MFNVSPESANFWFDVFNAVLLVGAVAVAVGTYGVYKAGAAKERFANERVSHNEALTARANQAVAVEQKRTAQLAKDAEALKNANLKLSLELEKERLARARIEGHVSSRTLSPEQRSTLLSKLAALRGATVDMRALGSDPEAEGFTNILGQTIADAGAQPKFSAFVLGASVTGVQVSGTRRREVLEALHAAGITSHEVDGACESDVCLLVGSKPRSM